MAILGSKGQWWNIFGVLIDHYIDYGTIKKDAELRPKSKMFGVRSIILSILGMILIPLTFLGIVSVIRSMGVKIFNIFIAIFLILILLYELLGFVIYGLMCTTAQLRLNKKPIGWVALGIYLTMLVVVIVSIISII